jgi:hypothetical protein
MRPAFFALTFVLVSGTPSLSQVYLTDSPKGADKWIILTENPKVADCWLYKGDITTSPKAGAKWAFVTTSPKGADKWVIITDNPRPADPVDCIFK